MDFKMFIKNQNYTLKEKELQEEELFLQENQIPFYEDKEVEKDG